MSTVRLSPTSYVVLGMVALRGPSTPYDLKRAVGHSVGHFWQFPHAQLYDEPARLAKAGLLDLDCEAGGRRRKVYSITSDGRAALRDWLRQPAGEAFQLRNIAELKLFFSELGDPEDVRTLAAEQISLHEKRLTEYEAIGARFQARTDVAQRMIPLRLGLELEHTALRFWRQILDEDKAPPPT
jgi:DNA-binding PadR family transcriptional regulator